MIFGFREPRGGNGLDEGRLVLYEFVRLIAPNDYRAVVPMVLVRKIQVVLEFR